ncbi:carboxypeptidase SOL1 isoform X5 [Raphanus sativus]|uniref:Carboxypeptidase SOL1 isoform X5 n=1 Tax=Raphanus sativus TaxID=3726 RepID=A0A9W3CJP7_RAPSA|nr:carboxypeptidase SOL1 isoform X5 [Raphanus sativus]
MQQDLQIIQGFLERAFSIGKSVNGFPLWVIEISDRPGEVEAEPAFKYIGNVHGDEPVGRELLMRLANWICDNYGKDPLAKLIVENVHLHILPSLNPDGFSVRKRNNANNVDLNRDFPDQFFPINEDLSLRQPETTAIMTWLREIRFTASATLHGGALVANFPWDGTDDKSCYRSGNTIMGVLMIRRSGSWHVYIANLTVTCLSAKSLRKASRMEHPGTLFTVVCKTGITYMEDALN